MATNPATSDFQLRLSQELTLQVSRCDKFQFHGFKSGPSGKQRVGKHMMDPVYTGLDHPEAVDIKVAVHLRLEVTDQPDRLDPKCLQAVVNRGLVAFQLGRSGYAGQVRHIDPFF